MARFDRSRLPEPLTYFEGEGISVLGRGAWRSALCVFHTERSPSLRLNAETGAWKCMGCGVGGGDVLDFHMQRHGLEFAEAAKALGAMVDDGRAEPEQRTTLSPKRALQLLDREALLVAVAAANVGHGVDLSKDDLQRVLKAAGRISTIAAEHCHG